MFQQQRAIEGVDLSTGGLWSRCAGAGLAVFFYLWKCVIPVGLVPHYPLWHVNPPKLLDFWPWVVIAVVILGLCRIQSPEFLPQKSAKDARNTPDSDRRDGSWYFLRSLRSFAANKRSVVFGLGWFGLNLLPVLGFIPMAYLRISWVADHFAYVPLAGFVGLCAAGASKIFQVSNSKFRAFGSVVIAALLAALAITSHRYARIFSSDESLWTYTLQHNPDSWTAQNDLGMDLAQSRRLPEAIGHYEAALRLKPDYAAAHVNLGNAFVQSNRLSDALAQYQAALRIEPRNREALVDLGNALAQSGQFLAAIDPYEQALSLSPDNGEVRGSLAYAHYEWGNALGNGGRLEEAIAQYTEAVQLKPGYAEAHANLGLAFANTGRSPEALLQLEEAVRLKPAYEEAHAYLGFALAGAGRLAEAIAQYEKALELSPNDSDVHYNLAVALRQAGRTEEANTHFEAAARLSPGQK